MNQTLAEKISAQGRLADAKLAAANLILTQGGEPTFVPHDTAVPEWNVAALGREKLLYARRLARELVRTLFPGGVILQSFGKHYPGALARFLEAFEPSHPVVVDLLHLLRRQSFIPVRAPEDE